VPKKGDNRGAAGSAGDLTGSEQFHVRVDVCGADAVAYRLLDEPSLYADAGRLLESSIVEKQIPRGAGRWFRVDPSLAAGHQCRTNCHLRAKDKTGIFRLESAVTRCSRGRLAQGNFGTDYP